MPLTDTVPSFAFDVLQRNAQDTDKFVNQETGTFTNRVGKIIKPIPVIEAEANAAVISLGWHQVGLFADGFTYILQNDIAKDAAGDWYRWNGALPKIVTAGTLPSSDVNFVKIDYKSHAELSDRNPIDGSAHNSSAISFGLTTVESVLTTLQSDNSNQDSQISALQNSDLTQNNQISALQIGQNASVFGFATISAMNSDLTPIDGSIAYVTNDPSQSNNGTYRKSGATGVGSWVKSSGLVVSNDINKNDVNLGITGSAYYKALSIQTVSKNFFNKDRFFSGYLPIVAPFDGVLVDTGVGVTSDYINIERFAVGAPIFINGLSSLSYGRGYAFYDKDLNNIDVSGTVTPIAQPNADSIQNLSRPSINAIYLRITVKTINPSDNTNVNNVGIANEGYLLPYEPFQASVNSILNTKVSADYCVNKPVNKYDIVNYAALKSGGFGRSEMVTLGDSITASGTPWNWPYVAKDILGCTLRNYAVSGAHWEDFNSGTPNDPRWLTTQTNLLIASGVAPDFIVIAMGTNSLVANTGDFESIMSATDINALDRTDIFAGMRYNIERLKTLWSAVPIMLTTPLQRANYAPDSSLFAAMAANIRRFANYYSLPVIECGNECGITYQIEKNGNVLLYDGLHPNATGSLLQGRYIASQIKSKIMV